MFSLSPPTRDRSATTLHMVRDRLLAMPGAPLKPESPLFGSLQTAVTPTVPAGTVRNWCMQPIVPAEHAGFVSFVRQFSFSMMLSSVDSLSTSVLRLTVEWLNLNVTAFYVL